MAAIFAIKPTQCVNSEILVDICQGHQLNIENLEKIIALRI